MRLVKYLAHCGVASRRAAEQLIADGRVTIGGEVVTDPARDVDDGSDVTFDGAPVAPEAARDLGAQQAARTSPRRRDEPGRRRAVTDLVASRAPPLSGRPARRRLDRADPADQRRRAREPPDPSALRGAEDLPGPAPRARSPTARSSGCARGSSSRTGRPRPPRSGATAEREIEITIREGRNRQVRRMLERGRQPVAELERIRFGSLALGDLAGARRGGSPIGGEAALEGCGAMNGAGEDERR